MISAKGNVIATCGGASNADRDGEGLTSSSCEADSVGPRMKLAEKIGQLDFLGTIKRAHCAAFDGYSNGFIYVGIGIPQDTGTDAMCRHIKISAPIEGVNR